MATHAPEVLEVRAGGRLCAIPAGSVTEILRAGTAALTRVPHAPPSLMGVTNLRGAMLPVLSLVRLLDLAPALSTPASRIVVIDGAARFGLLVDAVSALTQASGAPVLDIDGLLRREFGTVSARHAAATPAPTAPAAAAVPVAPDRAVLGVRIAGQEYGWPLAEVEAVLALADITALPGADGAMLGVMTWRDAVLPVVCLRALLGLPVAPRLAGRIVVVQLGQMRVGLVVDAMTGILRIPPDAIDPVPPLLSRGRGEARVAAICRLDGGRRLVSLLAPALLFDDATTALVLAQQAATVAPAEAAAGQAVEQYVIFRLGDEFYGLSITAVSEVLRRPDALTRVPRAPGFVAGVMNLRGQAVPVIDQAARFAAGRPAGTKGRMIVVIQGGGLRAGFVVDDVTSVLSLERSAIQPLPPLADDGTRLFGHAAQDAAGRTILLIDPGALLDGAERDLLAAFAQAGAGDALPG